MQELKSLIGIFALTLIVFIPCSLYILAIRTSVNRKTFKALWRNAKLNFKETLFKNEEEIYHDIMHDKPKSWSVILFEGCYDFAKLLWIPAFIGLIGTIILWYKYGFQHLFS